MIILVIAFPLIAALAALCHLPPIVEQVVLYLGYLAAAVAVTRFSIIAGIAETELAYWQDTVRRSCPPHQVAIIRSMVNEERERGSDA